jgi:phosphotriesterase-related protein
MFGQAGGSTIVELTCLGLVGRDVCKLKRIAEATGLHIIASTGFYKEPYYPPEVFELTIPDLAEVMVRELRDGIGDTGIRPGIIGELGTLRHHITPPQERVFRAAARAHRETGVAISTHTYFGGELALEQVRILQDEGVSANRIIIGHLGDTRVLDHYTEIAQTGVFIQFDHTGIDEVQLDRVRAEIIAEMVKRGFERQILLGCDVSYKVMLHEFGGHGYDHLLTSFVVEHTSSTFSWITPGAPCQAPTDASHDRADDHGRGDDRPRASRVFDVGPHLDARALAQRSAGQPLPGIVCCAERPGRGYP